MDGERGMVVGWRDVSNKKVDACHTWLWHRQVNERLCCVLS